MMFLLLLEDDARYDMGCSLYRQFDDDATHCQLFPCTEMFPSLQFLFPHLHDVYHHGA